MSQLVHPRIHAPRSALFDELKAMFRATPLAIFIAALRKPR